MLTGFIGNTITGHLFVKENLTSDLYFTLTILDYRFSINGQVRNTNWQISLSSLQTVVKPDISLDGLAEGG